MVYAKRKFNRFRKNLRNNRNLSTRRIFNNKSAKSQAKQIYALRRTVNFVKNQCKPEVKEFITAQNTIKAAAYTSAEVSQTYFKIEVPFPSPGTGDDQRIGNVVKMLPITMFLNGLYRTITHSSSGIPLYNVLTSKGCGMRVVAIQSKTASNNSPSISSIFDTFETSVNPVLTMANLNNPFKRGITAHYNILFDKTYYFNDNKPISNLRFKVYPKLKNLRWEQDFTHPQGEITFYVMFGGLESTSNNLNEADYNMVEFTYWMKLPYTDA